jgi:hypothetical protein
MIKHTAQLDKMLTYLNMPVPEFILTRTTVSEVFKHEKKFLGG